MDTQAESIERGENLLRATEALLPELSPEMSDAFAQDIGEVLKRARETEDMDKAMIMSMILNLQVEAMRRFRNQTRFVSSDVQTFGFLCQLLLPKDSQTKVPGYPTRNTG